MREKILNEKERQEILSVEIHTLHINMVGHSFRNLGESPIKIMIYSDKTHKQVVFIFELNPQQWSLPLAYKGICKRNGNQSLEGKSTTLIKKSMKVIQYL